MNDFDESNIPESNWMKFETPGDICKGTVVETYVKQAEGNFPPQTVYVLTNASRGTATIVDDGVTAPQLEEVGALNVGISKAFINDRLKTVQAGDKIAFAFIKEIPASTKGFDPAKSIMPYKTGIDEEYLNSLGDVDIEDHPFN